MSYHRYTTCIYYYNIFIVHIMKWDWVSIYIIIIKVIDLIFRLYVRSMLDFLSDMLHLMETGRESYMDSNGFPTAMIYFSTAFKWHFPQIIPQPLSFSARQNNSAVAVKHATEALINIPWIEEEKEGEKSHCLNENLSTGSP